MRIYSLFFDETNAKHRVFCDLIRSRCGAKERIFEDGLIRITTDMYDMVLVDINIMPITYINPWMNLDRLPTLIDQNGTLEQGDMKRILTKLEE